MQELILIALIAGAGYYLLVHQPKSEVNQSPTNSQATQTEPIITDNQDLENTIDTLLQNIKQLNHQIN